MDSILSEYSSIEGQKIDQPTMMVKTLPQNEIMKTDLPKEVCKEKCLKAFKDLVEKLDDINAVDSEGRTLLMHALSHGFFAAVDILLNNSNVDFNTLDNKGQNALIYACTLPHIKYVAKIMEKTDNINLQVPDTGNTAMHLLIKSNHLYVSEILYQFNTTALIYTGNAHIFGDHNCAGILMGFDTSRDNYNLLEDKKLILLEKFIEKGADLKIKNAVSGIDVIFNILANDGYQYLFRKLESKYGYNIDDYLDVVTKQGLSLGHMSAVNDIELFEILAKKGFNINCQAESNGLTPLYLACVNGVLANVKKLLSMGAKHDIKNEGGYYPIHGAIHNNNIEVVKVLLVNGVDVNLQSREGITPLYYATGYGGQKINLNLITYLIENGGKHDIPNSGGYYPIHCAAVLGHIDVIDLLLSYKFDINIINSQNGMTPLFMAMSKQQNALVKMLLEKDNIDLTIIDKLGQDVLCWGIETKDLDIIKILIDKKINLDHKDNSGRTALSWAAEYGWKELVDLLLEHNANINIKDNDGFRPIHMAVKSNNIDLIETHY